MHACPFPPGPTRRINKCLQALDHFAVLSAEPTSDFSLVPSSAHRPRLAAALSDLPPLDHVTHLAREHVGVPDHHNCTNFAKQTRQHGPGTEAIAVLPVGERTAHTYLHSLKTSRPEFFPRLLQLTPHCQRIPQLACSNSKPMNLGRLLPSCLNIFSSFSTDPPASSRDLSSSVHCIARNTKQRKAVAAPAPLTRNGNFIAPEMNMLPRTISNTGSCCPAPHAQPPPCCPPHVEIAIRSFRTHVLHMPLKKCTCFLRRALRSTFPST